MASKEQKVAELMANSVEDFYFNPATVARMLTEQPFYTTDRVMELVSQIIHWYSKRHIDELDTERGIYNSGSTSEGLYLANELNNTLSNLKKQYNWTNIKLPISN